MIPARYGPVLFSLILPEPVQYFFGVAQAPCRDGLQGAVRCQ